MKLTISKLHFCLNGVAVNSLISLTFSTSIPLCSFSPYIYLQGLIFLFHQLCSETLDFYQHIKLLYKLSRDAIYYIPQTFYSVVLIINPFIIIIHCTFPHNINESSATDLFSFTFKLKALSTNTVTPPTVLFMFIHYILSIWMRTHFFPTVNSSLIWLHYTELYF